MPLAAIPEGLFPQQIAAIFHAIFGGDAAGDDVNLAQVAARTVLVYLFGLVVVRIGKGRLIGRVTAVDILVALILGSLLSRGITGEATLSGTLVASVVLVFAHWLLTLATFYSHTFGKMIKGNALVVVKDGKPVEEALRHSHISENDLEAELRLHGVADVRDVRLAYKERNGQISVIRYDESRTTTPESGAE